MFVAHKKYTKMQIRMVDNAHSFALEKKIDYAFPTASRQPLATPKFILMSITYDHIKHAEFQFAVCGQNKRGFNGHYDGHYSGYDDGQFAHEHATLRV
jgi:RecB family exonuclease